MLPANTRMRWMISHDLRLLSAGVIQVKRARQILDIFTYPDFCRVTPVMVKPELMTPIQGLLKEKSWDCTRFSGPVRDGEDAVLVALRPALDLLALDLYPERALDDAGKEAGGAVADGFPGLAERL